MYSKEAKSKFQNRQTPRKLHESLPHVKFILHTCSGHANIDAFLVPAIPAGVPVAGVDFAHLLLLTEVRVKLLEGAPEKLL